MNLHKVIDFPVRTQKTTTLQRLFSTKRRIAEF